MGFGTVRRALWIATAASAALWILAWTQKGSFIGHEEAHPLLREEPTQVEGEREPFDFEYKGKVCRVRPVAEYDLRGLVVSHNDIESFADMVHDSTSVDTKDLCVIWGANLENDDFHEVDYKSGQFTCYFSYPAGVKFRHRALSNTHLITDRDSIRDQIADVRIGDQVRLTGWIADYQMDDWGKFWRRTSTTRTDSGCEVLFVESLEVLAQGTPGWYAAFAWSGRLLIALALAHVALLWAELQSAIPRRDGG